MKHQSSSSSMANMLIFVAHMNRYTVESHKLEVFGTRGFISNDL